MAGGCGIYKVGFAALIGLTLSGASPVNKVDTSATKPVVAIEAAKEPAGPVPTDRGCERGQDDRKSDLCAQWKSADAAADTANFAFWQTAIGIVGLVLGAITMGAAIAAAWFAKEAADHTQTGSNAAVAAHDAFVASERAILRVKSIGIATNSARSGDNLPLRLHVRINNGGRASAIIDSISWEVSKDAIFPETTEYGKFCSELIGADVDGQPLEPLETKKWATNPVWIMGFLNYSTLKQNYRTHFCYRAYMEADDGYTGAVWRVQSALSQGQPPDT